MASGSYKKWIIVAVIIILGGFLIISFTRTSNKGRETSSGRGNIEHSITGPLLDPESEERMVAARIKEYSDNPVALASIGDEYFETKRYAMAIKVYEKVLELNPEDVDTYNDIGLALHFLGRSEEAIMKLKKGTEIDPSFQRVWLSLSFVLISTGKTEEARGVVEKTLEIDPESGMGEEARKFISYIDKIEQ
jgi:tetratricopeptide (TPR) repeat protein